MQADMGFPNHSMACVVTQDALNTTFIGLAGLAQERLKAHGLCIVNAQAASVQCATGGEVMLEGLNPFVLSSEVAGVEFDAAAVQRALVALSTFQTAAESWVMQGWLADATKSETRFATLLSRVFGQPTCATVGALDWSPKVLLHGSGSDRLGDDRQIVGESAAALLVNEVDLPTEACISNRLHVMMSLTFGNKFDHIEMDHVMDGTEVLIYFRQSLHRGAWKKALASADGVVTEFGKGGRFWVYGLFGVSAGCPSQATP